MRPSFGFESVWSGGPFDAHGLKNAKELLKIVGRKSRLLCSGFGYFGEIAFYGRFDFFVIVEHEPGAIHQSLDRTERFCEVWVEFEAYVFACINWLG